VIGNFRELIFTNQRHTYLQDIPGATTSYRIE
jgi:hypothetical protein